LLNQVQYSHHILFVYIDKEKRIRGTYPFLVKQSAPLGKSGLHYNHFVDATSDITIEPNTKVIIVEKDESTLKVAPKK